MRRQTALTHRRSPEGLTTTLAHISAALCGLLVVAAASTSLSGCGTAKPQAGEDSEAQREIAVADSLSRSSHFAQAAAAYASVAAHHPTSSVYARAARNAGLLFASPANPAHDDSVAISWLTVYANLPASDEERDGISLLINTLQETITLRATSARLTVEADSLYVVSKKQSAAILVEQKKSRDLEERLKEAVAELARLKSVDVRTARSRRPR